MPTAEIKLVPPYDYEKSLGFCRRSRLEIIDRATSDSLIRIITVDGTPLLIEHKFEGPIDAPHFYINWQTLSTGYPKRAIVVDGVKRYLSADVDLRPFYRLANKDKRLKKIINRHYGLKSILTPTPYEAAAWSIIGQQINLNFAYTIKKRLTEKYGGRFEYEGEDFYAFPEPEKLGRIKIESLLKMQFSRRKAEYLIGFTKYILRNPFFDRLHEIPYELAIDKLTAVRGIGLWSANYIMMRGVGHLNGLPLGDSGLNRAVQETHNMKERPDNETVEKLARPFAPFRSLFTLYLWYSLMEDAG